MSVSDPEKELEALLRTDPSFVEERSLAVFDKVAGSHAGSIVLFGCGTLGLKTLKGLRSLNIEPLAFVDNNPRLWDLSVEGLRVLSPAAAVKRFGDTAVFVVTIYNGSVARRQLQTMHCSMVVPFAYIFWKYSEAFLPYYALDLPHALLAHADEVRRVYFLWEDGASRREYLAQLRWRLLLDFDCLPNPSPAADVYFPEDLVSITDEEVFVDCGAYDGDIEREIIKRQRGEFGSIIALEPDPVNFEKLEKYVATLDADIRKRIVVRRLAAASHRGKLRFCSGGTVMSAANPEGAIEVDCAPLDDIVEGCRPTYIKMDIEGVELDALEGARAIIRHNNAVWAICAYHRQEHLWQIPLLIRSFSDGYRFFLRRYAEECWEMVCYAIPVNRAKV